MIRRVCASGREAPSPWGQGRGRPGRLRVLAWPILAAALLPWPAPAHSLQGRDSALVVAEATAPPTSLDPFKVYGTQAQSLFRLIYAPLFDRDPGGRLVTPLLDRWGQTDPLTWEFRLREGVRFHDGGELTAADVVFSLRRIVDPSGLSPRRHEFEQLAEISALDRHRIRITTKHPYALLPARLSQFSMILPDGLRGRPEAEFFRHPIGVGPLRLESLDGTQAVLTPFPEYLGTQPKVAQVVFKFLADAGDRVRGLLDGSTDIVTNIPPQQVDLLAQARKARLVKRHSIRFMDLMIDSTRGPLANAEVRRALRYATDIESLIKYVARGNGRPLATTALPEDFGFDPELRAYPFDPARARALLVHAGYPHGFPLRGVATHDTQTLAIAVAHQWAKLGIKLDFTVEGRAPAIARWIEERGKIDFFFIDPTSILFDAAYHLRLHLDLRHPMGRSPDAQALDLLNRADSEPDLGARAALLRKVQSIVHERALSMPFYQVVDLYGVRDRVRDFVPSADTILRVNDVSLAP